MSLLWNALWPIFLLALALVAGVLLASFIVMRFSRQK